MPTFRRVPDLWAGQKKRRSIEVIILQIIEEYQNGRNGYSKMSGIITHETGLSRRKIVEDYIPVMQSVGYITNGSILIVTELGKQFLKFELSDREEEETKEEKREDNEKMRKAFKDGHPDK